MRRPAKPQPQFAIQSSDGSYYAGWKRGCIGPRFGVNVEMARKFYTRQDARELMADEIGFDYCVIVDCEQERELADVFDRDPFISQRHRFQ